VPRWALWFGGLDLVFVAGLINKLDGYFAVSRKIRTPQDPKGKWRRLMTEQPALARAKYNNDKRPF
jgi:hypothetical protein